jgi:hypothetical protein
MDFYIQIRILCIASKLQNVMTGVRNTITFIDSWKGNIYPSTNHIAFCTIWICNRDRLMPREHQMVVESHRAAGITPTFAILRSGMFHDGVYPRLGTNARTMRIAQMFYDSNKMVIHHFIDRRRQMGFATNVSFTHRPGQTFEYYIEHKTTLHILDMYNDGNVGFIHACLMRNVYQSGLSVSITVVSGDTPANDSVKIV